MNVTIKTLADGIFVMRSPASWTSTSRRLTTKTTPVPLYSMSRVRYTCSREWQWEARHARLRGRASHRDKLEGGTVAQSRVQEDAVQILQARELHQHDRTESLVFASSPECARWYHLAQNLKQSACLRPCHSGPRTPSLITSTTEFAG